MHNVFHYHHGWRFRRADAFPMAEALEKCRDRAGRVPTDPDTTYRENLWNYCKAALDKGAQPVLLTPVSRRFFVGGGAMLYTHGEYPRAVRQLAEEKHIPLIDLKKDSRELYLSLGEEKTAELFVRLAPGENPDFPDGHDDKTHFNAYGADKICALVVEGMRRIPECAAFLK